MLDLIFSAHREPKKPCALPRFSRRVQDSSQRLRGFAVCFMIASVFGGSASADHYTEHVKPLLAEKCIACHGPLRSEAGLRLDAAVFINKGSEEHAVVSKDEPSASLILQRISTDDSDQRMPPEGEGVRLTPAELAIIEQWISDGAPAPTDETYVASPREHWAYQPIVRPEIPQAPAFRNVRAVASDTRDATDASTAIDAGAIDRLLTQLQYQRGVSRALAADRETWLRRVTLGLNGLPPTVDEIVSFVNDQAPDAKDKVVDRLLARPAHGERWGRHWMDVWRYSDWDGYKEELRGSQRHIWHWRDWIIESINASKPYDQMIIEMLAADEVAPNDKAALRATGFLARNYHRSNRNIWLDATVEHTAKAFLGMTLACARCHDHKFDPLTQEEYYRFRAIFEPHEVRTQQLAGEPDTTKAGIPRAFDAKPEAKTFLFVRGNEKQPQSDKPIAPGMPAVLDVPYQLTSVPLPRTAYRPALLPEVEANAIEAAWQKFESARTAAEPKLKALRDAAHAAAAAGKPEAMAAPPEQLSIELQPSDALDPIAQALLETHAAEAALVALRARYVADHAKVQQLPEEQLKPLVEKAAAAEQRSNLLAAQIALQATVEKLASANAANLKAKKKDAAITQAEKNLQTQREAFTKARDAAAQPPTTYTPVGEVYPQESTGRRLALARWIIDQRNPLTARVAANHIWARHFGVPLVDDVSDFGLRAKQPITRSLLDWMADELRSSGFDMKRLHRHIALSQTYGLASTTTDGHAQYVASSDPENRLFWHVPVRRLDAEEIRDSLLAVCGQLDRRVSGPDLSEDEGEKIPRRSVYFRHAYEKQVALLVLFDGASPNECYRRSPSILPQQALALANSQLSRDLSRRLGEQLHNQCETQFETKNQSDGQTNIASSESSVRRFIDQLFLAALSRAPSTAERETCVKFLNDVQPGETPLARRQSLAHALINHNDFVVAR